MAMAKWFPFIVACSTFIHCTAASPLMVGKDCFSQTMYDSHWVRDCGPTRYIDYIWSHHDNHYEDRVFKICCSEAPQTNGISYSWTDWQNSFDMPVDFYCSGHGYISGIESYHSNHHEDRRWKFHCSHMPGMKREHCRETGWINSFDGDFTYLASHGRLMVGMKSIHSNHHEDRKFLFRECKFVPVLNVHAGTNTTNADDFKSE